MLRRTALVALFAVLVTAPRPAQAQSQTFNRTFTVSGDATLEAVSDAGNITIRTAPGSTVVVNGRVQPRRGRLLPTHAAAQVEQVAANPPVTQDGNTIRIARIADEAVRRAIVVSYEITVPARTAVSARAGSGNVVVEGTQLATQARTGSGNITVRNLGGDADLATGSGDIEVARVAGSVKAGTGSGGLRASGIGRGLRASTGSGEIQAELSGRGDVHATTGSGGIRLAGVVGGLSASTGSGDVTVNGTPTDEWKISTASGSVSVQVPQDAGFTLDARTASGSFDVHVPLSEGRTDRRRVQGVVRGGGPTLALSTASGGIVVR